MNFIKIKGIAEAVEEEKKIPSPSHSRLTHLVSLFMTELISLLEDWFNKKEKTPIEYDAKVTTPTAPIGVQNDLGMPVDLGVKKRRKKK